MKNKRSKEWLTKEEFYQIINYPYISRRDELIISLLYYCALRIGELEELRVRDINIDKGTLKMWEYKNSLDPALIPIPAPLIKMLNQWITDNKLRPLKYLFSSNRSKKISRTQYFRIVKDNVKAAGIKKVISSHTFRRSRATNLLDDGLPLEQVSRLLRHKHITSTMTYLKISIQSLHKAINKIDTKHFLSDY